MTRSRTSGMVGWIAFGAIMLVIAGTFDIIWGLTALLRDQIFVVGRNGNVISADYTVWGWVHLILGIIVFVTGLALFTGRYWARVLGVLLAFLSSVAQLLVIFSYPVWAVMVIALDMLVIYAIVAHGEEMDR
jgi:hypothetical protein